MSLKEKITDAMVESYSDRLANIADMVGKTEEEVSEKMKELDFPQYVALMSAVRNIDKNAVITLLGFMDEAYSQGSTVSPAEMRAKKAGQQAEPAQSDAVSATQKAQAMQRLGSNNLGGATAAQAADALAKAGEGKPLTPVQRKAMASQASSVDALANDPRTAAQFRNLLNKLNRK